MVEKSINYSKHGKNLSVELEENKKRLEEAKKKMKEAEARLHKMLKENIELKKFKSILDNIHKTPYEKKIALFKWLIGLKIGDMPLEEKKRTNYILQAHLYSDLAKQSMKDYKKITAEVFSKEE